MPFGRHILKHDGRSEKDLWNMAMAKAIGEKLQDHYRGHVFKVVVDDRAGVALVSIPALQGMRPYVLHLNTLKSDPGMESVIRAGGEILERWNIPRAGFNMDDLRLAFSRAPLGSRIQRDMAGNVIVPDWAK